MPANPLFRAVLQQDPKNAAGREALRQMGRE